MFLSQMPKSAADYSFEIEWDDYYSNVGYYQSLTNQPIPEVDVDDETSTYNLMLDSITLVPRFMLLEVGVYPLPIAGAYVKKNHPDTFDDLSIGDFNIIQSITAGYDEPYALSLFFGSIVRFVNQGEERKVKNRGYTGFLLSAGDQHIVQNTLVDDNWFELEWKIKGDQDFEEKTLSWSLRFGTKIHGHPDITDVIHIGLRRNHLDTASNDISWFQNADIDFKLELDKDNFDLT